jgi:hypothetical protein
MKCGSLFLLVLVLIALPISAQDSLPLTETFVSEVGDSTFDYPAGWVVRDYEFAFTISNSESAVEFGSDLSPGDMSATVIIAPFTKEELDADAGPIDIIRQFQEFSQTETCQPSDEVTEVERDGMTILVARQVCIKVESITLVALLEDDFFVLVVGSVPLGEDIDILEPILLDVAVSAKHITPDVQTTAAVTLDTTRLTQTFTSEDGVVTFRHPEGWSAVESENHVYAVVPVEGSEPGTDQIVPIIILVASATDFPGTSNTSAVNVARHFTQQDFGEFSFSSPTQFTINNRPASRADMQTEDKQVMMFTIALNEANTAYAVVNTIAPAEEVAEVEWLMYAIASTVAKLDETTAVNTATSPLVLSETFTSDDGLLHFDYPVGWVTEYAAELNMTMLASGEETVIGDDGERFTIEDSTIWRAFFAPETVDDPTQTPEQQLIEVLADMKKLDAENIIRFTVGDKVAASFTIDDFGNGMGLTALEIDLEDGVFLSIVVSHATGQYKRIEPSLLKILATVRYGDDPIESITPLELDASFAAENVPFTFDYPADWSAKSMDDVGMIGSVRLLRSPEPEEMQFIVDTMSDMTLNEALTSLSEDTFNQGMAPTNIVWLTVDGRDALRVDTSAPDMPFESADIVLDLGNGDLTRINMAIIPSDLAEVEPTLWAILASVQQTE